jgi:hypothetical protein
MLLTCLLMMVYTLVFWPQRLQLSHFNLRCHDNSHF